MTKDRWEETASTYHWHGLTGESVAAALAVDESTGLDDAEAHRRLEQHGLNRLPEQPGKPA